MKYDRPADVARARSFNRQVPPAVRHRLQGRPFDWREPVGCPRCSASGFSGRVGLFEVAPFNAALAAAVRRRAPERELLALARQDGYITMFEEGVLKAATGVTALSEIHRVIGPSDPETDAHDHSAEDEDVFQPVA